MKITADTILGEMLEDYPQTEQVMRKYLGEAYCLTCPGKMFDTVGNGAMLHGFNDAETANMLHDLQVVVDATDAATAARQAQRAADQEPPKSTI